MFVSFMIYELARAVCWNGLVYCFVSCASVDVVCSVRVVLLHCQIMHVCCVESICLCVMPFDYAATLVYRCLCMHVVMMWVFVYY